MMKDFVNLDPFSGEQLQDLIDRAIADKALFRQGKLQPTLERKTLAMIFEKPSLRTRVSFETAMTHLGGHAIYMTQGDIGLGKRESAEDTAAYVAHRLRIAAEEGPCPVEFTAEALADVHSTTDGIPRLINVLCDNALLVAYAKGVHRIDRQIIATVLKDMTCWGLHVSESALLPPAPTPAPAPQDVAPGEASSDGPRQE